MLKKKRGFPSQEGLWGKDAKRKDGVQLILKNNSREEKGQKTSR